MKKTTGSRGKSAAKPASKSAGTRSKAVAKPRSSSSSRSASKQGAADVSSQLGKLMEDELKDILWAEQALLKALPKMAKNATSPELREALENHLEETKGQIERLHQVFEILEKKPQAKKCEAMAGLVREASEIMQDCEKGVMRDAGIISAGQKVEHYEIASYGTLRTFAQTLGLDEVAELLQQTLDEEKQADEKLTSVAEAAINIEAAGEEAEDED
ncbi:MAG: ferritin-like domain-containing protein [Chitinophagales bacterium]